MVFVSPMNHIGRRLFPPIFIPNIGHNQSGPRIIALIFLTKNVSNKSAFFVQRAHPYRAFLRNHIRKNFTVLTVTTAPMAATSTTASTLSGRSTLLVLITNEQSHSRSSDTHIQGVLTLTFKEFQHSHLRSSTSHNQGESRSGLINRHFYYNTRAVIYQIAISQNLIKIKAVLILTISDVTKLCDSTKLLENK